MTQARTLNYPYGMYRALLFLGGGQQDQGDLSGAEAFFRQGLALVREHGDLHNQAFVLLDLARLKLEQGQYPKAAALYRECLLLRQTVGYKTGIIDCVVGLACLAIAEHRPAEQVATLFGAVDGLCPAVGNKLDMPLHIHEAKYTAYVHEHRTEPTFAAAWARGRAMSLEAAVTFALAHDTGDNG